MPDWMSHLLVGLILAELFSIRKKSLVVFGALMPDLLTKLDILIFHFEINTFITFFYFHTPVMCFLLSILIAPLFKYNRLKSIILINIGTISHFLSDLTMKYLVAEEAGVFFLFPFSMDSYTFNLIWPEQSFYILIASFFIYIFIRMVKKNRLILSKNI